MIGYNFVASGLSFDKRKLDPNLMTLSLVEGIMSLITMITRIKVKYLYYLEEIVSLAPLIVRI